MTERTHRRTSRLSVSATLSSRVDMDDWTPPALMLAAALCADMNCGHRPAPAACQALCWRR